MPPVPPRRGLLLSEKLFLLLIIGSLSVIVWLALRHERQPASKRGITSHQLSGLSSDRRQVSKFRAPGSGSAGAGGADGEGMIVARDPIELPAPRRTSASKQRAVETLEAAPQQEPAQMADPAEMNLSTVSVSAEIETPVTAAAVPVASGLSQNQAFSLFVPSKIGLPIHLKEEEKWPGWEDVNRENVVGEHGTAVLHEVFDVVRGTRAGVLVEDLVRKAIPVSFGTASDFAEEPNVIAVFEFASEKEAEIGGPGHHPQILFNPAFLNEDPRVLSAALVHEATHFQQFLDRSIFNQSIPRANLELEAWQNEAAFWEGVRGELVASHSALARQPELAYRTALRGEGALRDLLAALEG
jgi:hypothetical protein